MPPETTDLIGRRERATDIAAPRQMAMLAALLDHADPEQTVARWIPGQLPPLGHWLLFPPLVPQSAIGEDGHPRPGHGLIPDAGLPRRMWAGSDVRFHAPIADGATVDRETVVADAVVKHGRSEPMLFVTLQHRLSVGGMLAIEETQDIVYRAAADPNAPLARAPLPQEPSPVARVSRRMIADAAQLLRFSALTFNAHRIHYDRAYATEVERYPERVVHGPYLATLLLDHLLTQRPRQSIARFRFRALRPVFANEPFTLGLTIEDAGATLTVVDRDDGLAMTARATFA